MTTPLKKQIQALPTYLGGKRQLLSWLNSTLSRVYPAQQWKTLTFIDLFMGGGAVSFWAKAQGFQTVISNDISQRSQILAEAFLRNPRTLLSPADTLGLTQALSDAPGFIETTFCPDVFSTRHARALDQGFYWARQHPDPTKRALLTTVMWHLANDFVTFATSLGTSNRPFAEALDGIRSWDAINPKRFNDGSLKSLCAPAWVNLEKKRQLINGGVLGGSPVELHQQDAITLLPQLSGDILYLDPPYAGTVWYERGNQVLDALLAGAKPVETQSVSEFSKGTDPLEALLAKADHIPIWLLSYGNQALSLPDLEELVRVYAGARTVIGFSKRYQHLSHVSKQENNQELLILAYPTPTGETV